MYSWEINDIIKKYNNNIPSSVYMEICDSSPQIIFIKREYDNNFKIVTKEEDQSYNEWKFGVYNDNNHS